MSPSSSSNQPLTPKTARRLWVLHASFAVVIVIIILAAVAAIVRDARLQQQHVARNRQAVDLQLHNMCTISQSLIQALPDQVDDGDVVRQLASLFSSFNVQSNDLCLYVVDSEGRLVGVVNSFGENSEVVPDLIRREKEGSRITLVQLLAKSAFLKGDFADAGLLARLGSENNAVLNAKWMPEIKSSLVLITTLSGIADYSQLFGNGSRPGMSRAIYAGLAVIIPIVLLAYMATVIRVRMMFDELKVATGQYRNVFHRNPSAVLLVDLKDSRIRDASDAAVAFYGFPKRQLLMMSLGELEPDGRFGRFRGDSPTTNRLADGERVRIRHACHEGVIKVVSLNGTIVESVRDGQITRDLLVTVIDVTAQQKLEQELQRIADREKQRIGQDLHDSVGSELVGIAYMAEVLELLLRPIASEAAEQAARIASLISNAADEVRASARGLLPIHRNKGGLGSILARHIRGLREKHIGQMIDLSIEGDVDPPDSTAATHIFRIVQEAINNALKYADAATIKVELAASDNELLVSVVDDGKGFVVQSDGEAEGVGLHIIRSRADAIGGSAEIISEPGRGTTVRCRFPIRQMEVVVESATGPTTKACARS